jgi:predicted deacylase
MSAKYENNEFTMGALSVKAGKKASGELPLVKLITGNQISIPFYVFNGKSPGPVLWISAAIHGDEIAGVEVIRQIIKRIDPKKLSGTLVAVPIVNVHGF